MGSREVVDVWLSDRSPDWALQLHLANLDLPVLMGFLLAESWGAQLRLRMVVRDPTAKEAGRRFLRELVDQARLPKGTRIHVGAGDFLEALGSAGRADLRIFGMPPSITQARLAEIQRAADSSVLWLLDSGRESALA